MEFKEGVTSDRNDKVYECNQCCFTFKRKKNLQKHIHNKHLKKSIGCTKCENCFDSETDLKKHMNQEHQKLKIVKIYDKKLVQENKAKGKSSKINDHEINSEDTDSDSDILEPYSCPECGETCDDLDDFSEHFKQVHNW